MRVHVASILALFILTIACADPLCCADGCERGSMAATHAAQSGADCPTCSSAVVPPFTQPMVREDAAIDLPDSLVSPLFAPFEADVDHPPRIS